MMLRNLQTLFFLLLPSLAISKSAPHVFNNELVRPDVSTLWNRHAANNTELAGLPSSFGILLRDGFASAGDAPPLLYRASASPCRIKGGDGGSQVPTSDGKCWLAQFGPTADLREWGARPGAQLDTILDRAIAYACSTHVPLTIPYPGNNPYLVHSSILIGNGSATALSTCNGISLSVTQSYNESTSGTAPPGYLPFKWNGSGTSTVPFVVEGPLTQVELHGVGIDCANGANSCATGIQIINPIEGRFTDLGVEGNTGPAYILTSRTVNPWSGGNEGSLYQNLQAGAPGRGGSGMVYGDTTCTARNCKWATIANLLQNVTLNYDGTTAGTYGIKFGFASQSTFVNLRIACAPGMCAGKLGNAIAVVPPPGATNFPEDITIIHPLFSDNRLADPAASWTGTRGINFIDYSTVYANPPAPTSTSYALYHGTTDRNSVFPALQLPDYTVSTLPICNARLRGSMAYVTDAAVPTYNGPLRGGSNSAVPVFCNGFAWTAH